MGIRHVLAVTFALLLVPAIHLSAACIPFPEAAKHVGETKCVSGKVTRVEQGSRGVHYIGFCDDSRSCPFMAVVFAGDLKHVGDVRQLQGKSVEIHGDVQEYDGHAEIIIRETRQLRGEGIRLPPVPKSYDVEEKGRYSPGVFSHPQSYSTNKKRQPAKIPMHIPGDASE